MDLVEKEEEEKTGDGDGLVPLLPKMLKDSGYVVDFDGRPTKIMYMNQDTYLRILRGPSTWEKISWRVHDIISLVWRGR